jgi:hypothetical protein
MEMRELLALPDAPGIIAMCSRRSSGMTAAATLRPLCATPPAQTRAPASLAAGGASRCPCDEAYVDHASAAANTWLPARP